jgi:pyruvate formate lyase activating enzyme
VQGILGSSSAERIGLETSLNCSINMDLLKIIDFIIVDIKTVDGEIYKKYIEKENSVMLQNLKTLRMDVNDITMRLPIIPGYNNLNEINNSMKYLRELGYQDKQFEVFTYRTSLDD